MASASWTRRSVLLSIASISTWPLTTRSSMAGTPDPRLLVLCLRGGVDGLAVAAPTFDPTYRVARGDFGGFDRLGDEHGIDGGYRLNPRLRFVGELLRSGQGTLFHATSTAYRGRSHFDAQQVLESGGNAPHVVRDGWMNRLIGLLPAGERIDVSRLGLSFGLRTPLLLQGPNLVASWTPPVDRAPDGIDDVLDLYRHMDPSFADLLTDTVEGSPKDKADMEMEGIKDPFIRDMRNAGRMLSEANGTRVAAIDITGWDTHALEKPTDGRMGDRLHLLDLGLRAVHEELRPIWRSTVILLISEFGRTVNVNGSGGTDHGTGTVALALGGPVSRRMVFADWPGLSETDLLEGRDLRPTTDLRAVIKGIVGDHFGLSKAALDDTLFPGSGDFPPVRDLLA